MSVAEFCPWEQLTKLPKKISVYLALLLILICMDMPQTIVLSVWTAYDILEQD